MGRKRARDKVPHADLHSPVVLPSHGLADGMGKRMVLQAMVPGDYSLAASPKSMGIGESSKGGHEPKERRHWMDELRGGIPEVKSFLINRQHDVAPDPRNKKEEQRSTKPSPFIKLAGHSGTERQEQQEEGTAGSREFQEDVSIGSDGSGSESVEQERCKGRGKGGGSIERILKEKKGLHHWKAKSVSFRKKFLAASSDRSRNSRRKQIMSILKQVKGEPELPVNAEELTVVATVLDEAKLVSADQYLHEIKLMQVELGQEWNLTLERQLKMCKAGLSRNKGPEKRAKEVCVDELDENTWRTIGSRPSDLEKPAWSYAWATVWMLRVVEAAKVLVRHVSLKHSPRHVTLFIPVSKMDQKGKGVSRTLRCCGLKECHRWCAWALALKTLAAHKTGKPNDPLFPQVNGKRAKKSGLVRNWQKFLDGSMGGHSARRSGAMAHARTGMSVASISYLGRWRSTAVFRYVEEALQFLPSNSEPTKTIAEDCTSRDEGTYTECITAEQFLEKHAEKTDNKAKEKVVETKKVINKTTINEIKLDEVDQLFAVAPRRGGGKITHWISKAAWGVDLDTWSTACGWRFARRFEKVQLMTSIPDRAHRCSKCESITKGRDLVKGGVTLAQMLSSQFNTNK